MSKKIHKLSNSDKGIEIAKVALNGMDSAQNMTTLIFKIFGWLLIVSGAFLCITIIGLPIGLMLIALGAGMLYFYPKFSAAMRAKTVDPMLNILNDKAPYQDTSAQTPEVITENSNEDLEATKDNTNSKQST